MDLRLLKVQDLFFLRWILAEEIVTIQCEIERAHDIGDEVKIDIRMGRF